MSQLLTSFGVNWQLLLAQALNFGILLYLLKRFAYTPILNMLQKRESMVKKGLADAALAEKTMKESAHQAADLKRQTQAEAQVLMEEASLQAKDYLASAKEKAIEEKSAIVASAQKEIDAARAESESGLEKKVVSHIVAGVQAILRDEMNAGMNDRIIQKLTAK